MDYRIHELRKERGWSQQKVCEITGIHKSIIARYELEQANPTVIGLIKLSRVFDVIAD